MWSIQNLLSEAEAAKERLVSVIGQQPQENASSVASSSDTGTTTLNYQSQPTIATIPGKNNDNGSNTSNSSNNHSNNNNSNNISNHNMINEQVFTTLKSTWTSALTATKAATQQAIQTLEKEQTKIQARLFHSKKNGMGPYLRDISLPLDTPSLRDAQVVYITDRLITMGHPAMQSALDGDITPERKLAAVQHLLSKRHGGKYMIWNLSEMDYDYSIFDNQVMTFEFPGSPSPPLGLWMKIILSLESWLRADEKNVAVMHCLTGRGRTSTVMSAFLCWVGEASFGDPNRALEYMAQCKKLDLDVLTIPSQRRYVGYFKNMLDGVRPSQPPLLLKRVIMSEAPKFEKYQVERNNNNNNNNTSNNDNSNNDPLAQHAGKLGCAPYLQIFKAGKLIHTAAASKSFHQAKDELPFCFSFEKSITFPMETVVQGDILIRCRHLTKKGQKVSMFRAALHTGYVPPKVLRLRKSEIDGACSDDKRYADDFFIDLVFEECSADLASKHLLTSPRDGGGGGVGEGGKEEHVQFSKNGNGESSVKVSVSGMNDTKLLSENKSAIKVTASAYDIMLHRDSRFWDMIAQRRNEKNQPSRGENINDAAAESDGKNAAASAFYGPTIGRRREFLHEMVNTVKDGNQVVGQVGVSTHKSELHSFTIGGELDFTTEKVINKNNVEEVVNTKDDSRKDDLMDALMAIDDDMDEDIGQDDSGEIELNHVDHGEEDRVMDQNDDGLIATEEVIFYDDQPAVQIGSNQTQHVEKGKDQEVESSTAAAVERSGFSQKTPERVQKNHDTQDPANIDSINIDDLNIDDIEKIDAEDEEGADAYNFSDEDDDIADLEEFLKKATV